MKFYINSVTIRTLLMSSAFVFTTSPAFAQNESKPAEDTKITPLLLKEFDNVPGKEGMVLTVEYAPSASTPPHHHNAHVFVYVLEGSIVMQCHGAEPVTLDCSAGRGCQAAFKEVLVEKTVTRNALTQGKSIKLSRGIKLKLVDAQISKVRRISNQYTRSQRISRFFSHKFNVGKFATRTLAKGDDGLKSVSRVELKPNAQIDGLLEEQRVTTSVPRTTLLKGGSFKVDATTKKVLLDGKIVRVQRISDQYSKTQRIQRRLGRLFNVGEFAQSTTISKPGAKTKLVKSFELREIRSGGVNGQKLYREQPVTSAVRRLSSQGQSKRQLAAEATQRFFTTAAINFKIGAKKTGVFLCSMARASARCASWVTRSSANPSKCMPSQWSRESSSAYEMV